MTAKTTPKFNYGLGWRRDMPDHRNMRFEYYVAPVVELPSMVDLTKLVSYVKNQGPEGSCVSHGVLSAFEALQIKRTGACVMGCRQLEYRYARMLAGDFPGDNGATIQAGVQATTQYGVANESLWPYVAGQYDMTPPARAVADAVKDKTNSSYLLDSPNGYKATLANIKTCLAVTGLPPVYGTPVYEQIEEVKSDGIIKYPKRGEESVGGHCMMFCGYQPGYLWTLNSWGESWGKALGKFKGGFGLLPDKYVTAGLVRDVRVIAGETEIPAQQLPSAEQ